MNIVFLDIDGVLNSATSIVGLGMSRPAYDPSRAVLSTPSVGILRYLCEEIDDYAIYVHSSWASMEHVTHDYVSQMLGHHGFPDAKVLPVLTEYVYHERSVRIKSAIEEYKPDNYIILDDRDMTSEYVNQIVTDPWVGLTYRHLHEAKKVFPNIHVPIILL